MPTFGGKGFLPRAQFRIAPDQFRIPPPYGEILKPGAAGKIIGEKDANQPRPGNGAEIEVALVFSVDIKAAGRANHHHGQMVFTAGRGVYVKSPLDRPVYCVAFTQAMKVLPPPVAVDADPMFVTTAFVPEQKTVFPIRVLEA